MDQDEIRTLALPAVDAANDLAEQVAAGDVQRVTVDTLYQHVAELRDYFDLNA